jgi:hypothetical protein
MLALKESEDIGMRTRGTANRLKPMELIALLDARKTATSRAEIEKTAASFRIDPQLLDRIAQYVNTPTVSEQTTRRTVGPSGEEIMTTMVNSHSMC